MYNRKERLADQLRVMTIPNTLESLQAADWASIVNLYENMAREINYKLKK